MSNSNVHIDFCPNDEKIKLELTPTDNKVLVEVSTSANKVTVEFVEGSTRSQLELPLVESVLGKGKDTESDPLKDITIYEINNINPDDYVVKKGERYQHFKGNRYEILGIGKPKNSNKTYVLYQDIESRDKIWARPYDMFITPKMENGQKILRFTKI
jgi:hypothetical protein